MDGAGWMGWCNTLVNRPRKAKGESRRSKWLFIGFISLVFICPAATIDTSLLGGDFNPFLNRAGLTDRQLLSNPSSVQHADS